MGGWVRGMLFLRYAPILNPSEGQQRMVWQRVERCRVQGSGKDLATVDPAIESVRT